MRFRVGGLAVLVLFACEDAGPSGPPPPTPIRRPAGPPPPRDPPPPAPVAAPPPVATRARISLWQPELSAVVEETKDGADVWVVRASGDADPTAAKGKLTSEELKALWAVVDAVDWKALADEKPYPQAATLVLEQGGTTRTLLLERYLEKSAANDLAGAISDWLAKRTLTAIEGTTKLAVPAPPPKGGPIEEGSCHADEAGITCQVSNETKGSECYATELRDVVQCFDEPWTTTSVRVRPARRVQPPVARDAWALELGSEVACKGSGTPWVLNCSRGDPVRAVFAGPTRWVVVRAGAPEIATRVFPRYAAVPRADPKPGGPFLLELEAGNGMSRWSAQGRLAGDDRKAEGWSTSHSGGRRGDPSVELRRGALGPGPILALWKQLDALKWHRLPNVSSMATDTTQTTLYVQRGGAAHEVQSEGGCNCYYHRPTEAAPPCECPTAEAMHQVQAALEQLPLVKWKTKEAPVPRPAPGLKAVAGRCRSGGHCSTAEGKTTLRCLPAAAPGQMYCPESPWSSRGVLLKVKPTEVDAREVREPWAALLEGGQKCDLLQLTERTGRSGRHDRLGCENGETIVELQESGEKWLAMRRSATGTLTPVPVQVVYFPGARAKPAKR